MGADDDGDGVIIADIDADNPGFEIGICEEAGNVFAILDDATGTILYKENHPTAHINWITIADVDSDLTNGRAILGTAGSHSLNGSNPIFHYEADGTPKAWPYSVDIPFDGHYFNPIDWDGDNLLELYMRGFDNNKDHVLDTDKRAKIFGRNGMLVKQINDSGSSTVALSGKHGVDFFGDYREEVIARMDDGSIRLFFNTNLPPKQVRTKLQNPHYVRMFNSHFGIQPFVYALGDFALPSTTSSSTNYKWIKNKITGEYLREEGSGNIVTAPLNTSWSSSKWKIENSTENSYVWIKNKISGEYLRDSESSGVVTSPLNTSWDSPKWELEISNENGYIWIKNKDSGEYLRETGSGDIVTGPLNPSWNSLKWTLVDSGETAAQLAIQPMGTKDEKDGTFIVLTGLHLHPNPARGRLYVGSAQGSQAHLTIYSLQGRVLVDEFVQAGQPVDVSMLSPGLHLATIRRGDKVVTEKLIIE